MRGEEVNFGVLRGGPPSLPCVYVWLLFLRMKNNICLLFLRLSIICLLFLRLSIIWLLFLRLSIIWLLFLRMIRNSCFWYNYNENHQTFQFWLLILRMMKNLAVIPQNDKKITASGTKRPENHQTSQFGC